MYRKLLANEVITHEEKKKIDELASAKQMDQVLDILIDSLSSNESAKYKGFLLVLEKSDDKLMNSKADELRK